MADENQTVAEILVKINPGTSEADAAEHGKKLAGILQAAMADHIGKSPSTDDGGLVASFRKETDKVIEGFKERLNQLKAEAGVGDAAQASGGQQGKEQPDFSKHADDLDKMGLSADRVAKSVDLMRGGLENVVRIISSGSLEGVAGGFSNIATSAAQAAGASGTLRGALAAAAEAAGPAGLAIAGVGAAAAAYVTVGSKLGAAAANETLELHALAEAAGLTTNQFTALEENAKRFGVELTDIQSISRVTGMRIQQEWGNIARAVRDATDEIGKAQLAVNQTGRGEQRAQIELGLAPTRVAEAGLGLEEARLGPQAAEIGQEQAKLGVRQSLTRELQAQLSARKELADEANQEALAEFSVTDAVRNQQRAQEEMQLAPLRTAAAGRAVASAERAVPASERAFAAASRAVPAAERAFAAAREGVPAAEHAEHGAEADLFKEQLQYNQKYYGQAPTGSDTDWLKTLQERGDREHLADTRAAVEARKRDIFGARDNVTQAGENIAQARDNVAQARGGIAQARDNVSEAQERLIESRRGEQTAIEGVTKAAIEADRALQRLANLPAEQRIAREQGAEGVEGARIGEQQARLGVQRADIAARRAPLGIALAEGASAAAGITAAGAQDDVTGAQYQHRAAINAQSDQAFTNIKLLTDSIKRGGGDTDWSQVAAPDIGRAIIAESGGTTVGALTAAHEFMNIPGLSGATQQAVAGQFYPMRGRNMPNVIQMFKEGGAKLFQDTEASAATADLGNRLLPAAQQFQRAQAGAQGELQRGILEAGAPQIGLATTVQNEIAGTVRDVAKWTGSFGATVDHLGEAANRAVEPLNNLNAAAVAAGAKLREMVGIGGGNAEPKQPGGGKAEGGLISGPGTDTSDSIHAPWLSDGEFVVKAEAVRRPGALEFLHAFNEGHIGFASGGLVEEAVRVRIPRPQAEAMSDDDLRAEIALASRTPSFSLPLFSEDAASTPTAGVGLPPISTALMRGAHYGETTSPAGIVAFGGAPRYEKEDPSTTPMSLTGSAGMRELRERRQREGVASSATHPIPPHDLTPVHLDPLATMPVDAADRAAMRAMDASRPDLGHYNLNEPYLASAELSGHLTPDQGREIRVSDAAYASARSAWGDKPRPIGDPETRRLDQAAYAASGVLGRDQVPGLGGDGGGSRSAGEAGGADAGSAFQHMIARYAGQLGRGSQWQEQYPQGAENPAVTRNRMARDAGLPVIKGQYDEYVGTGPHGELIEAGVLPRRGVDLHTALTVDQRGATIQAAVGGNLYWANGPPLPAPSRAPSLASPPHPGWGPGAGEISPAHGFLRAHEPPNLGNRWASVPDPMTASYRGLNRQPQGWGPGAGEISPAHGFLRAHEPPNLGNRWASVPDPMTASYRGLNRQPQPPNLENRMASVPDPFEAGPAGPGKYSANLRTDGGRKWVASMSYDHRQAASSAHVAPPRRPETSGDKNMWDPYYSLGGLVRRGYADGGYIGGFSPSLMSPSPNQSSGSGAVAASHLLDLRTDAGTFSVSAGEDVIHAMRQSAISAKLTTTGSPSWRT